MENCEGIFAISALQKFKNIPIVHREVLGQYIWNDDFTRPSDEVLFMVEDYFRGKSYSVGLYTPYSNAKTVDTPADYNTLMIEMNKRIYMDEKSLQRSDNFSRVKEDIQGLYELILK